MKKKLRNLMAGTLALMFAGITQNVEATHVQGTEMNYTCAAPGVYLVKLKMYRDCSGIAAPTTASLNIKSQGCNAGRNVTMTKVGVGVIGSPYCPQIQATCSANSLYANYEETTFTTTVTFSPAEKQCPDWILSWNECCRPSTANLQGQGTMYTEAYLNLGSPTNPIYNNSPEFGSLVVPYVNAYQPITLSAYATDIDEDSLVYSFTTPLDNPTTSVPYNNYASILINDPDTNSTKTAMAPAGTFTATFPMHSFNVDWTQATPVAIPYFDLNSQNGSLSFTPTAYFPNSPSNQGLNKYVTVVQVDEYRRINGQAVKIGSIRRDMFITVMDCGPNQNPRVANPLANGQQITPNDIITLRPGTPLNFVMAADDNNANDVLEMTSDAAQILPGANFSVSPGNRPTGTLVWIPTANDVSNQIYYFRVTVRDNACPVRGAQVQTFGVRVSNTGGVTATNETIAANTSFLAYPNPFTNQVSFKFNLPAKAEKIVICNVLGQQVDQISISKTTTGEQHVQWQNAGKHASGIYVARLVAAGKTVQTLKFTKLQ
ncbi:T9SS type A sorting domain-containing protein [Adhaeribacter sp. BT258]|uniref:T9SS type A sorting domain-containing protein n=1 Tax=Adhaeribacter terrigena TaxID=2793070 RepID=A0ABS1C5P2_9BACT|nr:T9SS type A sorting domain-containing protein [Adhaeribacter terrigena]MBK0403983.1 T9SS type A sorting domain-containing protein [Adhaeribacter terrigena]